MTGNPSAAPAAQPTLNFDTRLLFPDGTAHEGYSFGFRKAIAGEVVFNTAMSGYPESLTDPSYQGQILVLTYPLIGNYGVPPMVKEHELLKYYESENIHIAGLIISEYSFESSHWNAWNTLSSWLIDQQIPAIGGVDTRAITKVLRENGSMPGKIVFPGQDVDFADPNEDNLVAQVSTKEVLTYGSGKHKIVLVDCGVKHNIIRKLLERDTTVVRVPWDYDFTKLDYDGLFISNGPGDPKQCTPTIANIAKALKMEKPIFGICLGNQLMALAAGGDTFKLKYGHRSHNQPVILKGTPRCFITSQNHGFATLADSLSGEWEELFVNINDNTNEGIKHKTKPFFSTQFHPEASSGPTDTDFLFDDFIEMIEKTGDGRPNPLTH
ncbi:MAG: carbamoyl-phosphate synthase (glutamine-hydrolyzing) small subunit [Bacteroidetes bacterium]|nr:MAG: carbamoyl-phosphate synthase (glutamine-hydrolyzing) small subunit [Bacteroidota bacterium]